MIRVVKTGRYAIGETSNFGEILILDDVSFFALSADQKQGKILLKIKRRDIYRGKASGNYRMYEVKGSKQLSNTFHLELNTGKGTWISYLLSPGLPANKQISKVKFTTETISKSTSS